MDSDSKHVGVLGRCYDVLRVSIDLENVTASVVSLEQLLVVVGESRVQALYDLHTAEVKLLMPKDKDKTELDRNVLLRGYCADVRRDYELLLMYEQKLQLRLDILLTLLV